MEEILKDKYGRRIGRIVTLGNKKIMYDSSNRRLGEFDGRITKDALGRKIGEGNLLVTLLK